MAAVICGAAGGWTGRSWRLLLLGSAVARLLPVLGRRAGPGGNSLELVAGATATGCLPAAAAPRVGPDRAAEADGRRPARAALPRRSRLGPGLPVCGHGLRHLEAAEVGLFANLKTVIGAPSPRLIWANRSRRRRLGRAPHPRWRLACRPVPWPGDRGGPRTDSDDASVTGAGGSPAAGARRWLHDDLERLQAAVQPA